MAQRVRPARARAQMSVRVHASVVLRVCACAHMCVCVCEVSRCGIFSLCATWLEHDAVFVSAAQPEQICS